MADAGEAGPGWYPDPSGRHQLRYFATTWTDHVSDAGIVTNAALSMPPPAVAYGAPSIAGPMAPAAATARANPRGAVLVLVGGILMVIGPLFPWETATSSGIVSVSSDVKGTSEGAGPVVLAGGLVVAALAALVLTGTSSRRKAGIATLVIALVSFVFCIGNWSAISKDVDKAPRGVDASLGIGLILAVIGCMLAAIASIALIRRRDRYRSR